ncbi:MAG: isoprenylcysteine carboxylmethyltransferase family protein [Chitinophagales bacterium]|nr:isoprenylcysteine carboxylmethyltransferase family protein [Chitinophagales bacterium]
MPSSTGVSGYINSKKDFLLNLCFALSFFSWAAIGIYKDFGQLSSVRLLTSLLNLEIGILILFRLKLKQESSPKAIIKSLPSLLAGGLLFKLAQDYNNWSYALQILFALGACFSLYSFYCLGKNFSIFPSKREISTSGAYKVVRHPAYLGESIMLLALALYIAKLWVLALLFIYALSLVWRIHEEETLLTCDKDYILYKAKTPYRLIPFLW